MELILFDENLKEIGPSQCEVDIEIGDIDSHNDLEVETSDIDVKKAYGIYAPGTELGGIFEYSNIVSNSTVVTRKGWTWRGLLENDIVKPDPGNDYKIVGGDANSIIKDVVGGKFGGFFSFRDYNSGITVSRYQFILYTTLLEGLMDMLEENNAKLKITAEKSGPGGQVKVYLEAVASKTIESTFDEDTNLEMELEDNRMGITTLFCAGKGELQDRLTMELYLQKNGSVSRTNKYYTGFLERRAYYDYSSAQDETELEKNGRKRLLELAHTKVLNVQAPDQELDVGDFVSGQQREMGVKLTAPICKKIVKITMAKTTYEYKVKGSST